MREREDRVGGGGVGGTGTGVVVRRFVNCEKVAEKDWARERGREDMVSALSRGAVIQHGKK